MLTKIYELLPVFLQNIVCSAYGYKENRSRFSGFFYNFFLQLKESDFFSKARIYEYKTNFLVRALLSAKKSKHYKDLSGFSDDEIRKNPWGVVGKIPILTKNQVRDFVFSDEIRKNNIKVVTSGTTGKALLFYKDKSSVAAQWAVWFRHRGRFNVFFKQLSVNFTGKPVVPASQIAPPFWRFNKAQNQYLIGMQQINENNIDSIVGFLNTISPVFYSGYPSIISEVARLAMSRGLTLNASSRPSAIFTGAEKLIDYQKEVILAWSDAQVTDQYGLSEGCCNFSKCEYGNYHEDFEFCHIEIADGETLSDGSVRGRLIGTAFFNEATPFIKYDTGDIAIMAPEDFCCPCGRESRVIFGVDGRVDDYVLTPDGRRVMRFDYLFKDTNEVLEAQVLQFEPSAITIRAVLLRQDDRNVFEEKVRRHFDEYIAAAMDLRFEYVSEIEKTSTGKFKAVVNRLK